MSDIKLGHMVIVRNRTRPAGYQVYPGVVTAIHAAIAGLVAIDVTGFPGGGAQYTDDKIKEIDVQSESPIGWYSVDDEAARPSHHALTDDRGPLSSRAKQRAAKESDVLVQRPYAPSGSPSPPFPEGTVDHGPIMPPIV